MSGRFCALAHGPVSATAPAPAEHHPGMEPQRMCSSSSAASTVPPDSRLPHAGPAWPRGVGRSAPREKRRPDPDAPARRAHRSPADTPGAGCCRPSHHLRAGRFSTCGHSGEQERRALPGALGSTSLSPQSTHPHRTRRKACEILCSHAPCGFNQSPLQILKTFLKWSEY